MEITAHKIPAIGIYKDDELVAIVIQNGKPTWYSVEEHDNKAVEELLEVNRAQI